MTGAPKNYVIRRAVSALLDIFERATGVLPSLTYSSHHTKTAYGGDFYPFAVASLTPIHLIPPKQLGSAILAGYKEWRDRNNYKPAQK